MLNLLQHDIVCVELANLAVDVLVYRLQICRNHGRIEQRLQGTNADGVILSKKPLNSLSFPIPCRMIREQPLLRVSVRHDRTKSEIE